jgi:hypothetical protein
MEKDEYLMLEKIKNLSSVIEKWQEKYEKLEEKYKLIEKEKDKNETKYVETNTSLSDLQQEFNLLKATPKVEVDKSEAGLARAMFNHALKRAEVEETNHLRIHGKAIQALLSHIRNIHVDYNKLNKSFEMSATLDNGKQLTIKCDKVLFGDGDYHLKHEII